LPARQIAKPHDPACLCPSERLRAAPADNGGTVRRYCAWIAIPFTGDYSEPHKRRRKRLSKGSKTTKCRDYQSCPKSGIEHKDLFKMKVLSIPGVTIAVYPGGKLRSNFAF
jgi:hypothetical protein